MGFSFETKFNKIVRPIIKNLNGKRILLPKDWMQSQFIYKFPNDLWFDCSYDWRDMYFQAGLGRLYSFHDVMPRAVVLENFDYYLVAAFNEKILIGSNTTQQVKSLEEALKIVANTIPIIIENYSRLRIVAQEQIKQREYELNDYLIEELHEEGLIFAK